MEKNQTDIGRQTKMENQHICHERLGCIKIKLYSGKEFRQNLARKVSSKCLLHKAFWDPDIYILSILRLKLPIFFQNVLMGIMDKIV